MFSPVSEFHTLAIPSKPVERIKSPWELNFTFVTSLSWPLNLFYNVPMFALYKHTVESADDVTNLLPNGLKSKSNISA